MPPKRPVHNVSRSETPSPAPTTKTPPPYPDPDPDAADFSPQGLGQQGSGTCLKLCDKPVLRAGGLLRGPACRGGDGAGCRGGLRGQLIETRQEMAMLQASSMGAGRAGAPAGLVCSSDVDVGRTHGPTLPGIPPTVPGAARSYAAALAGSGPRALAQSRGPGVGESGASVPRRDHEHAAFLTPSAQTTTKARDVLRLLKTNIDPASKGITDIVLRYTRYGLTVFSNTYDTIQNLVQAIQENAGVRASILVRVPNKRHLHIRFSGDDPDVNQDRFFLIY
ncbi:hypothetical protein MRX96_057001 [Rhipicephalus microplus]